MFVLSGDVSREENFKFTKSFRHCDGVGVHDRLFHVYYTRSEGLWELVKRRRLEQDNTTEERGNDKPFWSSLGLHCSQNRGTPLSCSRSWPHPTTSAQKDAKPSPLLVWLFDLGHGWVHRSSNEDVLLTRTNCVYNICADDLKFGELLLPMGSKPNIGQRALLC